MVEDPDCAGAGAGWRVPGRVVPFYTPRAWISLQREQALILTAGGAKRARGGSLDGRCDLRGLTATALGDGGEVI